MAKKQTNIALAKVARLVSQVQNHPQDGFYYLVRSHGFWKTLSSVGAKRR